MFTVANIKKILYPSSVIISGVTFDTTKSGWETGLDIFLFETDTPGYGYALQSHWDELASAKP